MTTRRDILTETDFFETLVEKGSDAIISIDEDSTIVYANESVERIFGHDPEDVVGEPLTVVMPERFREAHHDAVERYLRTGERDLDWNNVQLPGEHADGHEIPLSITFEEHEYEGRRLFSGIIRDVTEQRRYEKALEDLQATTRELMRCRNADEIADTVVSAVEGVLGYPFAAVYLYEETDDRLEPATLSDALREADRSALSTGRTLAREAFDTGERVHDPSLEGASGDENEDDDNEDDEKSAFPARSAVAFPIGEAGALVVGARERDAFDGREVDLAGLIATATETALDRADREARLARQNEQLERFASIVSHDLRDPLNAAKATLTLARAETDSESIAEYFDQLESIHGRMAELIEDVLTLAREGQSVGETATVDFARVVGDAWETVGDERADLVVADDLGTLQADEERFRTLLENLLANAVRHAGPEVTVEVGRLDSGRGFYVADDGPGIPEGEREDVFEYGYTSDREGTGLGLNIVSEIADAHGWTATVTDAEDGGARFEFAFAGSATIETRYQ